MMRCWLSIGGNVDDACINMAAALERMCEFAVVEAVSPFYNTKALDGVSPDYVNAVALICSDIPADELSARFKAMERDAGRCPEDKARGIVALDIDIVIVDDRVVRPADYRRPWFETGYLAILSR